MLEQEEWAGPGLQGHSCPQGFGPCSVALPNRPRIRYFAGVGTLRISLLGGFKLDQDGVLLNPIPSRAGRSLLAFLLMNRERAHTRDLLAGTFWPDLPDTQARRRLSQALWQIRTHIGRDTQSSQSFLLTRGDTVSVNSDAQYWLDVEAFGLALSRADAAAASDSLAEVENLEIAVGLYRGDLLEGFYDDWALPDRERLRRGSLRATARLSDIMMSRGDYEAAILHALRLSQLDPFQEEAHQRVMRLAVLLGRHNDAIRQYRLCRRILSNELGTQPSRATRELLEATLREREHPRPSSVVASGALPLDTQEEVPFVGRERERSALQQQLDAVVAARGGLALIEGEAGIGKTRLLSELATDAYWRGMDVLWGRPIHDGGGPYAPLTEALIEGLTPLRSRQLAQRLEPVWLRQLAQLVPALRSTTVKGSAEQEPLRPADEPARMMESITLAFTTLADITPLMVVLDDMHWADSDTVQALAHLAARTENHRLLVAISYRHTDARDRSEIWALLRTLSQRPTCTRVSLKPCSLSQTEQLVRSCLGLPDVSLDLARRVFDETGGVPLLVIEALRGRWELGRLADVASGYRQESQRPERASLSIELRKLLRHRVDGLPVEARAVLDLLSVHDGELTLSEVVAALDFPDAGVLRGIDSATQRHLLVGRSGRYQLSHELLRRVLYDDLPTDSRPTLHSRLASVIEAHRPEEVELLAHHFRAGGLPDRAAVYLEQAAVRAIAVSAYSAAVDHLTQAAEVLGQVPASPTQRFRVLSRLEEILDLLARGAEQERVLAQMQLCASGGTVIDVIRRRSWWLAHHDRLPEAEVEARRAVTLASAAGDPGRQVAALSTLGMLACFAGRAIDGVLYLERAATLRGADLRQQADARNAMGQNLLDLQRFDEAEPQLLAALALYGELQDRRGQAEVLGMLGTLRMERGESDLAESALLRALETSRLIGYRHGEAVYQMNLGILYALSHKPQSARGAFVEAANTYEQMGNQRGQALVLSNSAWLRHAVLGEDDGATSDARKALRVYCEMRDARGQAQCLGVLGSVSYRRGKPTEAVALFEESLGLARQAGDSWIEAQVLTEWARCELEAGLAEPGFARAESALALCLRLGMRDLAVSVKALQGHLLVALGRPEEALAVTSEALRESQSGVDPPHSVAFAHSLALAAVQRCTEADHFLGIAYTEVLRSLGDLPDTSRRIAIDTVPAHRSVVDAWTVRQPERTQFSLARVGAPIGRPLTPDERISVTWTLHSPDDLGIHPVACRRRHRLLRLLSEAAAQNGAPTIPDLAHALGVSKTTVRRDLVLLRNQGVRARSRGSRKLNATQP